MMTQLAISNERLVSAIEYFWEPTGIIATSKIQEKK
jgi:hypothetical protein